MMDDDDANSGGGKVRGKKGGGKRAFERKRVEKKGEILNRHREVGLLF